MKHTFFHFVDTDEIGELCTTYNYFDDSFNKELSSYRYNPYPDFKNKMVYKKTYIETHKFNSYGRGSFIYTFKKNNLKTLRNTKYLVEEKNIITHRK